MKKHLLAIAFAVAAIFAAASFFAGCDFVGTVPDYYYSYNADLTQEAGRELYDKYNGSAVYVEVTRYERDVVVGYRQFYFNSSAVYVSRDGWAALPAAGFVQSEYYRTVDRYSVNVIYFTEEGGTAVQHEQRFYFYENTYNGQLTPIEGNIFVDEEYGVALVKLPIEGRDESKYIPVLGNEGIASLGERLWLFSAMPDMQGAQGGGLISGALLSDSDVRINTQSYAADYVTTRSRAEYMLDGRFHKADLGGMAVNASGQPAGLVFSRIYSDSGSTQHDDIYGKACMADISHIADLLERAGGEYAQ